MTETTEEIREWRKERDSTDKKEILTRKCSGWLKTNYGDEDGD